MSYDTPDSLTIELSAPCVSESELIDSLIDQFGFPRLYESSWFGFREHLFYDPGIKTPKKLVVNGFSELMRNQAQVASMLRSCFDEYIEDNPDRTVAYE